MPPTLKILASFNGNLTDPEGSLLVDGNGNLLSTTFYGGNGWGSVFEVAATASGYASTPTALVTFNGTNGGSPKGSLIADANGDLFGTTYAGGTNGDGAVFEIVNTPTGYAGTPTTLASFNGTNGSGARGSLIVDANGNLFGTTSGIEGNTSNGNGTVFEIAKTGTGYTNTITTLVSFNGTNGGNPRGSLLADANGDLFGTTGTGGTSGYGTVFEIANTATGYAGATTLASFDFTNGNNPLGSLIADANGDLFGTTCEGGASNDGTVFEIAKTTGGYANTITTLVSFNVIDGSNPHGSLIVDDRGDLFGTTDGGGANNDGTVFEIANTATGYASTPTTLVTFNVTNGADPLGNLIADANGNLFGTTAGGNSNNTNGTVFEITGSGFDTACFAAGTHIATRDGEVPVQDLAPGDLVRARGAGLTKVIWIGRREIDCQRHPEPRNVWPVRVRAGAFGDGMPFHDLWLSPDHSVFVDGLLIPIKHLINRASIVQEPTRRITYFHVELARHDVLIAEGLPVESYLDTGNRSMFANAGMAMMLHPDFATVNAGLRSWKRDACAPLAVRAAEIEPVWRRLAARGRALGHAAPELCLTTDPRIRLEVGGRELMKLPDQNGLHAFVLPPRTGSVRLVSRASAPSDVHPWTGDRRRLGIYVSRIRLRGGARMTEIPVDHPSLKVGWWKPERDGIHLRRWTDGGAELPLPAMDPAGDMLILEISATGRDAYQSDIGVALSHGRRFQGAGSHRERATA